MGIAEVSDDSEAGGSGVEEAAPEDHAETQPPGPSDALRDFHRTLRPAKGVRPLGASTGRFLVLHETHNKHDVSQAPAACVMAAQCSHAFAHTPNVRMHNDILGASWVGANHRGVYRCIMAGPSRCCHFERRLILLRTQHDGGMMHELKGCCTLQQASGATKERLLDKLVTRQQKKQEELQAKAEVPEGKTCSRSCSACGHKSLGLCCI